MNIKVDRNLFLSELHYVQGVAGTKQIIPALSHLPIETGAGRIAMPATDLDLMITTECEAVVREQGSICLPSRKLMEIVKSLPQAEIEIKANDLYQATINCAPSRFKMNGLSADDFPESQASLSAPQVLSYENPPLLIADKARVIREDGTVDSVEYGLHTFLELTGAAYKVMDADDSRLDIRRLWWKPGEQIQIANGCPQIFYKTGQWGLGTEQEPPEEWREISNHVVFAFNDPNNWDIDKVDFIVGGADPQDFYQTDVWAGFDPNNDQGRSHEEMSESYCESCKREIRNLIGNAVPKNFSWDDLLRFVPEGEQIIAVTPEYKSRRKHRPAGVNLLLSNDELVRLSLF